ncbi:MAG: rhodanese-like domain-containing protein [Haloferacaceae archaeon]
MSDVEVDPETVATRLDEFDVVDVRDPADYAERHVPDAENVPLDDVEDAVTGREWGDRVAVICYAGRSSVPAAKLLDAHTDADAVSVAGGYEAWDGPVVESVPAE